MSAYERLYDMAIRLSDENEKLKAIIEKLAPEDGNIEFDDNSDIYCYNCGCYNDEHKPDCIWLEARKLLEELK